MKITLLSVALALVGFATTGSSNVSGQSVGGALAEAYGQGVHAYNSGDYINAYSSLSLAIDNGMNDPRAYYYRGIVAYRTGRSEEARGDWLAGAKLEAAGPSNPSIGRALSRIQGTTRIELEKLRQSARLQAMSNSIERSNIRYGELGGKATPARPAAAKLAPPSIPAAVANDNPFADDIGGEAKVDSDDPFADAISDATADADAAKKAASAAAPAGGAAVGGNVFGGGNDAAASPFGGEAPADNPFGGSMDADSPFGDSGDSPF